MQMELKDYQKCWCKYVSLHTVELINTPARNYMDNDSAKLIAINK